MFTVRPYEEGDAEACGECLYDGFFTCPVTDNDRALLRDYAVMLVGMSGFAFVAETEDGRVAGFICGRYHKRFSRSHRTGRASGGGIGFRLSRVAKYMLNGYRLSEGFRGQFSDFMRQIQEGDEGLIGAYDIELLALSSRRDCRKGVGTALLSRFLERAREDGAEVVKVFTNTLASWEFYERRRFERVAERPMRDRPGETSLVYEYRLTGGGRDDRPCRAGALWY